MFRVRQVAASAFTRNLVLRRPVQDCTRFALSPSSAPRATARLLHQSFVRRADEDKKAEDGVEAGTPGDAVEDTVTSEAIAGGINEQDITEERLSDPQAVDAAAEYSAGPSQSRPDRATRRRDENFRTRDYRDIPPSKVLYVGNLFFEVTAKQLEDEFSKFGTVLNARLVSDPRGLSRGFGYIEFETVEQATEAMASANQKILQGRNMVVNFHIPRAPVARTPSSSSSKEPSKTLFIGNMSYQLSDKDLNDLFRDVRNVLDVRVAIDRRTGQPRGFAHADFIDVQSAAAAKEKLEKVVLFGRQLRVDFSAGSGRSARPAGDAAPESSE